MTAVSTGIRVLSLAAIVSWCLARLSPAAMHREPMVGDRFEVTFAPRSEEPE